MGMGRRQDISSYKSVTVRDDSLHNDGHSEVVHTDHVLNIFKGRSSMCGM
jgi:hypothetical protein